ncbi:PAS domain-containing protein [Rhodovulum sp. P5]|uniref:sensor domain-containing protein n=1 Tax=Rhodovulum sp. P5 TaxID=1564506 RepID=UPI00156160F5|nr:PAS domain-containing protein [Rhodovulum sp. P5]
MGDDAAVLTSATRSLTNGARAEHDLQIAFNAGQEPWRLALSPVVEGGQNIAIMVELEGPLSGHDEGSAPLAEQDPGHCDMLRAAAKDAGFAQWVLDPSTRQMRATEAHFQLLGFDPFEVALDSDWVRDRLHGDDRAAAIEKMERLLAGESDSYDIDYRLRCKDGSYKWFQAFARVYARTEAGAAPLVCGNLTEISARKETEDRLGAALATAKMNERLLYVATHHAGIAPWVLNPATGEFTRNDQFGTITGRTGAELPKSFAGIFELIHPDDVPLVQKELGALAEGQSPEAKADFRLLHRDGHWVWCTSVARPFPHAGPGEAALICGVTFDISERKSAADKLAAALEEAHIARAQAQEAADVLRHSTENSNVVPWYRYPGSDQGKIADHMATILGYGPDFVIDRPKLRTMIHPDDLKQAAADFHALDRGEIDAYTHSFRMRRADGTWCWFSAMAKKVDRSADGLPLLICGSMTDIEHVKQSEEDLAQAAEAARQAQMRLSNLVDNIPGAVFERRTWPDGRAEFPYFSANMPDLFGSCPDEIRFDARANLKNVVAEDVERIATKAAESIGHLTPFKEKVRVQHPEKGLRWIIIASLPHAQADGSVISYGSVHDVTDQVEAEQRAEEAVKAARLANERFVTMAENAPGAIFECTVDQSGKVFFEYFSSSLLDLMGVERAAVEADGAALFACVPPEDAAFVQAEIARCSADLSHYEVRHRVDHPEKGLRWILASVNPARQHDGSVTWYGSIIDVTEQTNAERRVAESVEEVRRANDRFLFMAENTPGAIFECKMFPDGAVRYEYFSPQLPRLVGVDREAVEADGNAVFAHVPAEDVAQIQKELETAFATFAPVEFKHRVNHPEKGERWLLVFAAPTSKEDGTIHWCGNLVDITDRMEAEQRAAEAADKLRSAHERLTLLADISTAGLYEYRRFPDGTSDFPYSSARFNELVGYSREQIDRLKDGVFGRIHPEDLATVVNVIDESQHDRAPLKVRFRIQHPDRGTIWVEASAKAPLEREGVVSWSAVLHDVTVDVQREEELRRAHRVAEDMRAENERQAMHDGLTGLPNRRFYDTMLAERLVRASAAGEARDCVLIRLDLDHFKYVNDTLGHEAGDLVLIRVAAVLRDCLREGDFAARIGGDEFSILLAPGMSEAAASALVERIRAELAEPLLYEGRQCRFGASFGIAATDDLAAMGDDIQMFADAALYRAKDGGRNRSELFTPALHREILQDRRLAVEIHEGLDNDQFVPFFQPQISAEDNSLVGVEALLRWNHPADGLLTPASFMHVAEQLRLVPEIDRVMMEKSRDALARWNDAGLIVPKISFNVSAGRMHDSSVVALAREMLSENTTVTFELLESILVEEENETFRRHLDMLRADGVEIEIDDFGSGHASIIGLMEICPSALKIDQRIVLPVEHDLRARNLVRAIVEIAETLGIGTIAEGVETKEQVRILRSIGCNVLQGYLFAHPLCEDMLLRYARGLERKTA